MKIDELKCPYGEYRSGMKIYCTKINDLCGHVYYKRCKGWWTQSDQALDCPLRKDEDK